MKVYSTVTPPFVTSSEGKLFVNCNITERTIAGENDMPDRVEFVYDSVEVENLERGTLISGVMQAQYSKDQEIALLNAQLLGTKPEDCAAYQEYRVAAKAYVDSNLS